MKRIIMVLAILSIIVLSGCSPDQIIKRDGNYLVTISDEKICGSCFDKLTTNKPSYTTYCCTHCKARNWNSHMKKPIQNYALRVRQRDDIFEHLWDSYQRV